MPRISTNRPLLRRPGNAVGATGPLAGVRLVAAGEGAAVELATRQLWTLGCQLGPHAALAEGAGRLALGSLSCAIDWAGPVALPLRDEAGVQAACGIAQVHGRRHGGPLPLGIDYASAVAGVLAVQGLLAARFAMLRGSAVREVRTSVAQAALLTVGQYLAAATADETAHGTGGVPDGRSGAGGGYGAGAVGGAGTAGGAGTGAGAGGARAGRTDAGDSAVARFTAAAPPFTSGDGVRFEIEALEPGQWLEFWSRLGVPNRVIGHGWPPFQLRFATARCRLPVELAEAAAGLPYQELAVAAAEAGLAIVPVRAGGPRDYPAPPWRIARAGEPPMPPGATTAPPVALPLAGVVVVEMTRRLQGPLAGLLLSLLGAEVIRIEPLGGDPLRGVPPMVGEVSARFHALNRGKRVVEADPRSTAGRRAIRELVGGADVFLHNLAPGKAEEFELDAERLLAEQPGLVHAWASGWGELFGGKPPFGTDYLVQAHSGLAALVTPPGRPVTPSLLTITDIFGGLVSTEGVLAALLARAVTGYGQRVESSLWSAAVTLLDTATPPRTPPSALRPATIGELAADPRFAGALERDGCLLPRSPWEFHP
ncbi:CoA transferase [Kitasatospora sp. NBC_01287]|uniref:CoA transferase n=1 Tax=Kitasatospora sp. NBC_01287 TaxID=2903573 RepID=UPI00224EDF47|nr:CoA transferase [Kitasatospora sp. NBC_01287]MCX4744909.1 CoA transferase [Kitasatospora sp. NBC_01287]